MGAGPDLLRLLEPTVRPGGAPGPTRPTPTGPIETRDFGSLLEEVGRVDTTGGAGDGEGAPPAERPTGAAGTATIAQLAQVDRIENGALRRLIGSGQESVGRKAPAG